MAGGATQHWTTARDCNMMPCPIHVLSVWCATFRPPASTEMLQKVASNYKYYFANRSLWRLPFGPACRAGRQQTAFSAGVVAPLVYPGLFVETMSAICTLSKSILENGHAPPRHAGLRGPPFVLVICDPISRLRVLQFQFRDTLLRFLPVWTHATVGTTRRSRCISTGVSGAAGRPCLLQAFACWEPAAGPRNYTWDVRSSAHSASGVASRPFALGSQDAPLLLALSCRIRCIDNGVSGAASRPYLLQNFARVALPIAPQEPAAGLFLSGAARRPCYCRHLTVGAFVLALESRKPQVGPVCCRPLRFGCRLSALLLQALLFWVPFAGPFNCTVLGDVHGFTHSASGISATASLPNSLAFLAATILANTLYSDVCANVPAGGGFHTQSVCVSGVSNAVTSCLKSWPSKILVRYSFDFSENGQMNCGDGSVRARKPLLQPPLTVWPFWGLLGRPFSEKLKGCALPLCFGCRLSALWHQVPSGALLAAL